MRNGLKHSDTGERLSDQSFVMVNNNVNHSKWDLKNYKSSERQRSPSLTLQNRKKVAYTHLAGS